MLGAINDKANWLGAWGRGQSGQLPNHASAPPVFRLAAGAASSYQNYSAQVNNVAGKNYELSVQFTAAGAGDLLRPEGSCLRITDLAGDQYMAWPSKVVLTRSEAGAYSGTIQFPALITGAYAFQYACEYYSLGSLGEVQVPHVGVSRYDEQYYAVVLGTRGNRVHVAAHGGTDLRHPSASCLDGGFLGGETVQSGSMSVTTYVEGLMGHTLIGVIPFDNIPSGPAFNFSCADDYPSIDLT